MTNEIIFHNYATSPFSEKVRLVFGIKKLAWRSVEIPSMMPKPLLLPLTGGYRKTPVMQIGADVYCDTQIIIRELERRFPEPSIFPHGKGLPYALGFWADRPFFMATVPVVFGEVGPMIPEEFKKDRAAMSGGTFSVEALQAAAPFAKDQWRAHAAFLGEQLADGRAFLQGSAPTVADVHAYLNLWFVKNFIAATAAALLKEFPAIDAWYARVTAIGHGKPTPMSGEEALAVAKAATPEAKSKPDPFEPRGLKPGDRVTVSADDYGRDQIAGEIVFSDAHEIAILRRDKDVGDVVVHFPRAGFVVARA
ncbi:MAG TPA: glutathione S-transferase family protein [Rhizomicrobium sp.]|nr:glutathione S-transferase family protein [Rhizomicrobium sp.]